MLTCMLIERIRKEPTLAEAPLNIYIYILVDVNVIYIAFMRMTINFAMFILSDALWILEIVRSDLLGRLDAKENVREDWYH